MRTVGLLGALLVCATIAIGFSAPAARADSVSLSIEDGRGNVDPTAGISQDVVASVDVAVLSTIFVKARPAGGPACASTPGGDPGDPIDGMYEIEVPVGESPFGAGHIFPTPGPWQFCIWLAAGYTVTESSAIVPTTQTIALRPEGAEISATEVATVAPAAPATTVTIAGRSDIQVTVLASYRPASGPPCAAVYGNDPGTTFVDSTIPLRGRFIFVDTVPFTTGAWMICMWLVTPPAATPAGVTFLGPVTSGFTAVGPATAAAATPASPVAASQAPAVLRLATRLGSSFPKTAHRLRLSVTSHVSASRKAAGTCLLEQLRGGSWHATGARAALTAKGTCVLHAGFSSPGRRRLRVVFRPATGFAAATGAASWVSVERR